MGIDILTLINPLMALVLPFTRILAFIHFCPVLDNRAFSKRIKAAISLALAVIITPMLPEKVLLTGLMSC